MRLRTSLAVAVFALARAASAQSLPQWTGELTAGEGRHTARAGTALFFDDYGGLVRVGLGYRITGTSARAAYVKLDSATDGDFADNLVCAVTPGLGRYVRWSAGEGTYWFAPLMAGIQIH